MNLVLESTKFVVENSEQVKIDPAKVAEFSKTFKHEHIKHWLNASPFSFSHLTDEQKLNFLAVFNSISFSYWGEPNWTVNYKGKKFNGSWGMIAALNKAIENKIPILDFRFLSNIGKAEFKEILLGNVEIPLLEERWKIVRELGKTVNEKFDGNFAKYIKEAKDDAVKLLQIIVSSFKFFDDTSSYKGKKVYFYKRAQLLVSDIDQMFQKLENANQLTGCSDYKIPWTLRNLGILTYSHELTEKVDNKIELPKGSEEEIEIRASTIWAIEMIKEQVKKSIPDIKSMHINDHLWLMSQKRTMQDVPYHLTRTTAY